jgi:hypothetical protein
MTTSTPHSNAIEAPLWQIQVAGAVPLVAAVACILAAAALWHAIITTALGALP